jgi:exopolysaccharide production protein ExoQ
MSTGQVILLAATILTTLCAVRAGPLRSTLVSKRFTVGWVVSLAAWPYMASFSVAPIIWSSPQAAGQFFPVLQYFPAAAFSVAALIRNLSNRTPRLDLAGVTLATLFPLGLVFIILAGNFQLINAIVAMAIFAGVLVRGDDLVTIDEIAAGCRYAMALLLISLTASALADRDSILGPCRIDKCDAFTNEVVTSTFAGNGNIIGIIAAVMIPFALYGVHRANFAFLAAGLILVELVAASRSALAGVAIAIVLIFVLNHMPRPAARLPVALSVLAVAFVYSLFPLCFPYSGTDFSQRGYLWNRAKELFAEAPLLGHGPPFWQSQGSGAIFKANYSPHNGWLDITVALGITGVVVCLAAVVVQIFMSSDATKPYLVAYYATILPICAMESIYVPFFLGIAPCAAILPLLLDEPKRVIGRRDDKTQLSSRSRKNTPST